MGEGSSTVSWGRKVQSAILSSKDKAEGSHNQNVVCRQQVQYAYLKFSYSQQRRCRQCSWARLLNYSAKLASKAFLYIVTAFVKRWTCWQGGRRLAVNRFDAVAVPGWMRAGTPALQVGPTDFIPSRSHWHSIENWTGRTKLRACHC